MTWSETTRPADGSGRSTLLVPLGATEQHGPHLPLATDTLIARAWAEAVADRLPAAVVAPALPFGSSGEHQGFAGTLSIGGPALRLVVVELARSAAETFDRLVLLSGHAGNLGPLTEAADQLRYEGHDVIDLVPTWPAGRGFAVDAHAGRTETSLLLHLHPELVRLELAEPGRTDDLAELIERLMAEGVRAVAANGVLGDPTGASAEEGRRLFGDLVDRTVDTIGQAIDRR
ncbi:MAG: mycofactocin biosynthesis peptidyl-dipeptidase MftE [Actinomycetota bacterium]